MKWADVQWAHNVVFVLFCFFVPAWKSVSTSIHPWHNSCGYTRLLPKVTQWAIALGWDRFGFPARFNSPVTLQIITQGQLLTWRYLAGKLIHHGGDRKLRNVWLACGRSSVSYTAIPGQKICHTKRNRTNGYIEQRQVKYTHWEPRKLAMFDATCFEFGICLAAISAQHHKNVPSTCCTRNDFRILLFLPPDWLNYSCG